MMRLPLSLLLSSLVLLLASSCSSSGSKDPGIAEQLAVPYSGPSCSCGSEEGLLRGCEYEACVAGRGNPENPECFCYSPLVAGGFGSDEFAGAGGAGAFEAGASGSGRQRYVYLRSGKSYKGTVQSDDRETLVLLTVGGNEVTIPYSDIAPRSVYALNQAKVAQNDFDGQMKVANYARDNGLFGYAKRHYQRALRADEGRLAEVEREVAVLRRLAAEEELGKAREALARGDSRASRKHLVNVIEEFPGEAASDVAQALFDEQFALERAEEVAASAERAEDVQRALKPAQKHLERAREHEHKGLKNSRSQTQSIRSFKSAVSSAKRAYGLLDKLERRKSSSPELLAEVARMKAEVERVGTEAYVHAANAYLARGSHYNALESANAALKIDPDHEGARSVRRRAEDSVNRSGWGWGWYPGGGHGWGWGGIGVGPDLY